MKFRLTYSGDLKSTQGKKTKSKWMLRKAFHDQLVELWSVHPTLDFWRDKKGPFEVTKFNRKFVPLAIKEYFLLCTLDILFLRRGQPGQAMKNGDIDNRIKMLIDGLRLPQSIEEMENISEFFGDDETIYCLMEDDDQVSGFSVETDILLKPEKELESQTHADLVLTINIKPNIVTTDATGFLS